MKRGLVRRAMALGEPYKPLAWRSNQRSTVLCSEPGGGDMTSDTDELEHQLRENLRLRRELAAEVAKAKEARSDSQAFPQGVTMSDPSRPERPVQGEAVRANYRREEVREKRLSGEQPSPQPPNKTTVRTRGGVTEHNVRYVLAFGLAGVIIAFIVIAIYFGGLPNN
jgi:chorismate mutase